MKTYLLVVALLFASILVPCKALAYNFPVPNKVVPFTEGGVTYTHQREFYSNTGSYYVHYCPGDRDLSRTYQSGWKIYLERSGCQQYKYNGSSWVSNSDGYYYTHLSRTECLENVIQTNGDLHWISGDTYDFNAYYCNIDVVSSDELLVDANWNFAVNGPYSVLSPIEGVLEEVGSLEECSDTIWCFNQHGTDAHVPGGGIGDSDDSFAWDINLNYPDWDTDNGMPVYAVANGAVSLTYAEETNAGGTCNQVLIEHTAYGFTWWSGYLHMANLQVTTEDPVDEDTVIGYISDECASSVNHLHFVVYTGVNANGDLVSFDPALIER